MILHENEAYYPLRTVYGIRSEFDRDGFIPSGSDRLVTSDEDVVTVVGTEHKYYYYDRTHRGKSWFILDLAIDGNRRVTA
jgi:hypothetical protein